MTIEQQVCYVNPLSFTPNRESYDVLVTPHLHLLKRWVKSRVQNIADADDIIQQTLLLAFRHMDQFRYEASFGTWLCSIAVNVIRGNLRRPDHSRIVSTDPRTIENLSVRDPRQSALAVLERREVDVRLHRAISKLPELYRIVVELRDLRCLSIHETAKQLSASKPAIKSRHRRARIMLLKLMKEPSGAPRERVTSYAHQA